MNIRTLKTFIVKLILPTMMAVGMVTCLILPVQAQSDKLKQNFLSPSPMAKPSVWWFWGESTTTEHGITKDLEALKRVGFGGVVLYEQVFKDAPDALKSLSPEWMARVRFAAAECARLGIRLEVNTSNGYVAGGPWITPALGMQRLVSSETYVTGGKKVSIKLSQPPTKLDYYQDVAVIAFPSNTEQVLPAPKISSSLPIADLDKIIEYGVNTKVRIGPNSNHVMVEFDYGKPVNARSLTYAIRAGSKAYIIATQVPGNWSKDFYGENMATIPNIGELQASTDKIHWKTLRTLPGRGYQFEGWDKQTLSFPATQARYFRLNLHDWGRNVRAKDDDLLIGSVKIHGAAKVDQWEKKSGNTVDFSEQDKTPEFKSNEIVHQAQIIDLKSFMDRDGQLNWDAPKGNWTILRIGHTPTGVKTKHGRPETLGLECDKLSADAVKVQFDNYVGKILTEIRSVPGATLAGVNMDSAEHGSQNWTSKFPEEFLKRRGYRLYPYLPAMAGYIINSRRESDKFLYDIRLTISEMMSDLYYGTFQQLCHEQNLTFMAQAPGIATCMPSDNIRAKGRSDIPMAEFWMSQENGTIDCKEASSAAHVYGVNIVAAESFTGSMADATPSKMKPLADAALAQGVNRFVVLAYMHQPWDDRKPGVTEERNYLPYQRHNTWWESSENFWNTIGRSSAMMQSGKPVVDILYHLGSDAPVKIATWRMRPVPPTGYDYDVCSDEILLRAKVKNGMIILPSGMSYKLLILAGGRHLSLAAAKHVLNLVKNGAAILGDEKLSASPTLSDGNAGSAKVKAIGDRLWGRTNDNVVIYGKGKLLKGMTPGAAMAYLKTPADVEIRSAETTDIVYNHRREGEDEIYFLANHEEKPAVFTGVFRVSGLHPQIWDPESGVIENVKSHKMVNSLMEIPFRLEGHRSVVLVFRRNKVDQTADMSLVTDIPVSKELNEAWQVSFKTEGKSIKDTIFSTLKSWADIDDTMIKSYSGTATYTQNIELNSALKGKTILDLGRVDNLASLKVNGKSLGTRWKRPYAFDISGLLHSGKNTVEISVTNLWVNRLITDSGLPEDKRLAWATFNPYKPTDKLVPSGLLGPVLIREELNR